MKYLKCFCLEKSNTMSSSSLSLPLIELAHKQIKFTTGLGWIWSCRPPIWGSNLSAGFTSVAPIVPEAGQHGVLLRPPHQILYITYCRHMPLSNKLCQPHSIRYRIIPILEIIQKFDRNQKSRIPLSSNVGIEKSGKAKN